MALYRELVRRGYENVRRYSGGLLEWEDAGLPLEGTMVEAEAASMTVEGATTSAAAPAGHPYAAEIERERLGWQEIVALVRSLTR